ncbi:MAG: CPBP family intramembrane glutamic endopeptidase [Armatimonadota bacterium]
MELNTENREKVWLRYAIVAFALILFIFLRSQLESGNALHTQQTEESMSSMYYGDLQIKLYFYTQYALEKGVTFSGTKKSGQMLPLAFDFYQKAAKGPSPAAIRRAGVMSYELHREGAVEYFDKLVAPATLKGLQPEDVRKLRGEAAMWRDVYAGKLTANKADEYAKRINILNLGPARAFALEHLFSRVNQFDRARQVISAGKERAAVSFMATGGLFLAIILAGLAGVVFIILFAMNGRKWIEHPAEEPEDRTPIAKVLFTGFIAYLLSSIALGLIAGISLSSTLEKMPSDSRVFYIVILEFGLIVATGLIGLGVVYHLLKQQGRKLDVIGLTTRKFLMNILWGVAGYCALLPLLLVAGLVWNILSRIFFRGVETPVNEVVPLFLSGNTAVIFVVILLGSVLAPFFEEIFFRGMLYNALRVRMSIAGALVLASAAFAIIHPFPGGFLPIFAIASVFNLLFETRRSLVPSMVAHAIHNSVIFLFIYLLLIT